MVPWLTRFYFGDGDGGGADDGGRDGDSAEGLKALVSDLGDIDAREVNSIPVGEGIVVRVGRYGPYVERATDAGDGEGTGSQRASVPEDLPPDELTVAKARELLEKPSGDKVLGADPATGRDIVAREGRYGPYVTEVLSDDATDKPRTSSLFRTMDLENVTLDEALRLLTLPRSLGTAPDGEEVAAQNGRYGPYVKKGTDSRSLETEEQLFTVTLDEALALFAQPKARGRRAAAAPPLRELGRDPQTGQPVVVKEGRFGPYVTDGETNASLRKADAVETVTIERAAELLADRRARGPAPTKRAAAPRKKAAAPRKRAASARKS
jgi:DNA topoisomerase-1